MTFRLNKTAFAAAVAVTATVGLAFPAAATPYHHHGSYSAHRSLAYREGYRHGFRDGHLAAAGGALTTGRSAYVAPGPVVGPDNGVFGNGGLLGLGILGGNGLLGTGALNGQGALGIGVLGL